MNRYDLGIGVALPGPYGNAEKVPVRKLGAKTSLVSLSGGHESQGARHTMLRTGLSGAGKTRVYRQIFTEPRPSQSREY